MPLETSVEMNDPTISLLVATIGAVSGLFPVAITLIVKRLEQSSDEHAQKRAIESAYKRLEFLNLWVRTQQLINSDEEFAKLVNEVGEELAALRGEIRIRTSFEKETSLSPKTERHVQPHGEISPWQKAILGYLPKNAAGWVFHLLFYMAFGACVLLTPWVIYATFAYGNPGSKLMDWITLGYGPPVLAFVLAYLFWRQARIIDKRHYKDRNRTST